MAIKLPPIPRIPPITPGLAAQAAVALIVIIVVTSYLSGNEILFPPANAIVLVNDKTGRYLAPPCVAPADAALYTKSTVAEADARGLSPDGRCVGEGGFTQMGRSMTLRLISAAGLYPPLASRWAADGSWNW